MKHINSRLIFSWFTSVVFLTAYFIFISSANIFQNYAIQHNFSSNIFPFASIIGMRISLFITFLCTLKSFQSLDRQHFLMLLLMLLLCLVLVMPLSFDSYPFLSGFSNAIFDLTEPWRQFFVPPALRTTIEGITEGLTGIVDLSSVAIENGWSQHLSRYHYLSTVFMLLLLFFWVLARKLEHKKFDEQQATAKPKSILALIKEYPYIFVACLFGGINTAIFNYTLFLIKAVAPTLEAQNYQYTLYLGSIILPILLGPFADKKGVFFTLVASSAFLIVIRISIMILTELHILGSTIFYIQCFLLGGLTAGVWTLIVSLVGERLRHQGIFRAFAISNIIFQIGFIISGRVYEFFNGSFQLIKLFILVIDIVLLSYIWHFYKKEKHTNTLLESST